MILVIVPKLAAVFLFACTVFLLFISKKTSCLLKRVRRFLSGLKLEVTPALVEAVLNLCLTATLN